MRKTYHYFWITIIVELIIGRTFSYAGFTRTKSKEEIARQKRYDEIYEKIQK